VKPRATPGVRAPSCRHRTLILDMRQSDVLIVGGGPAGAWAACQLARAGGRVRMFDASHPREKPCGGGLTGRVLRMVGPVLTPDRLRAVPVTSLRFESGSAFSEVSLPAVGTTPETALVVIDRRTFDAALMDAACRAGATHVRERVRRVRVAPDGVEVETDSGRWRGDVLLGADGAASLVRRRLCGPFTRAQLSIATGCFVHGVTSSEVRIRTVGDPPGYIWSFPRATHLAVGICAQADVASADALRDRVSAWLDENHLADGARREPYSWPIPSLSSADFAREHPAGDRWMLLGDAAGLVDPLTREGIYFALASAQLSVDTLARGASCHRYIDCLREQIYPELSRAADVKVRFFASGFSDLMIRGFDRSAAVRDVMIDLVAGRQPYATLKRRLLGTFEIGLALRLLRLQVAGRVRRLTHLRGSADSRS
jgi:geranylgeranyl reductase family protein